MPSALCAGAAMQHAVRSSPSSQYFELISALLGPRSVRGSPIFKGFPATTFGAAVRHAHLERSQGMDFPHRKTLGIFALVVLLRVGSMLVVEEQAPLNLHRHLLLLNLLELLQVPIIVFAVRILRDHLHHHA